MQKPWRKCLQILIKNIYRYYGRTDYDWLMIMDDENDERDVISNMYQEQQNTFTNTLDAIPELVVHEPTQMSLDYVNFDYNLAPGPGTSNYDFLASGLM